MKTIRLDGTRVEIAEDATLAAGLLSENRPTRVSRSGELRGPLCGMGSCHECRVTVDGTPAVRSCLVRVEEGARIDRSGVRSSPADPAPLESVTVDTEVLVVGAGPAGLAAAVHAAEGGRRTCLLDENSAPGGQIWRRDATGLPDRARRLVDRARAAGVELLPGATLVDGIPGDGIAGDGIAGDSEAPARWFAHDGRRLEISAPTTILATGARERFLPFPGWTLPGVVGVGGLQALAKGGLDLAGKRIVLAGTGPLILAVAAFVRERGGLVDWIVEQAPASALRKFQRRVAWFPTKLAEGLSLLRRLRGIPRLTGSWPLAAEGEGRVERVTLRTPSGDRTVPCNLLAVGFGLVPETRAARLFGAAVRDESIVVDAFGRTSVPGLFAAGEGTGIGGVAVAEWEGEIAGRFVAGYIEAAERRILSLRHEQRFARAVQEGMRLRPELRAIATDECILCRCEDVTVGAVRDLSSAREAKLRARLGMGSCQGRVCGPAARFLFGWEQDRVRPPLSPVPLGMLSGSHR